MNEVYFDQNDIEQNKTVVLLTAILQCIGLGILFFLPLVACKDSEYGKFYANQGLLLLIASVICGIIPVVGWIAAIAVEVFAIMNAVNAYKGVKKAIPIIGDKFVIFK